MATVLDRLIELRERLFGRFGRQRSKRPPERDEPPAMAGAGVPRTPRVPTLAGGAARTFPPDD
jgi:hypothetical protein